MIPHGVQDPLQATRAGAGGVTKLGEQSPQGSLGKAHRACGKEGAIRSFFRDEREPTGENHMRAGKHSPFIRKGAFQSWYR